MKFPRQRKKSYDLEKLRIENDQTVVKSMRKINKREASTSACFLSVLEIPPLYVLVYRDRATHATSKKLVGFELEKKRF